MADIQTFGKLEFNFDTQIMELQVAYVVITLQEIYDSAHDASANLNHMDSKIIARASGQNDLGGGLKTGLTVELLNGWRLKAADRGGLPLVRVAIEGGNFITAEANGPDPTDPLAPANYVTYSLSKAVSSTITAAIAEWTQMEKDNIFATTQAIENKTDHLPADPAAQSLVQDIRDIIGIPTSPTIADNLYEIQVKTDTLPTHPADEALVEAHVTAEIDSVKGAGFTDETLKKIKELIETVRSKAGFKI